MAAPLMVGEDRKEIRRWEQQTRRQPQHRPKVYLRVSLGALMDECPKGALPLDVHHWEAQRPRGIQMEERGVYQRDDQIQESC